VFTPVETVVRSLEEYKIDLYEIKEISHPISMRSA